MNPTVIPAININQDCFCCSASKFSIDRIFVLSAVYTIGSLPIRDGVCFESDAGRPGPDTASWALVSPQTLLGIEVPVRWTGAVALACPSKFPHAIQYRHFHPASFADWQPQPAFVR